MFCLIILCLLVGMTFLGTCINTFCTYQLQKNFEEFEADMSMVLFDDYKEEEKE